MVAWRYEISLLVSKKIFHSFAALTREIFFQQSKRNFLSPRGHVISSLNSLNNIIFTTVAELRFKAKLQ